MSDGARTLLALVRMRGLVVVASPSMKRAARELDDAGLGGALTRADLERAFAKLTEPDPHHGRCPHTYVPMHPSHARALDGHPCPLCGTTLHAPA